MSKIEGKQHIQTVHEQTTTKTEPSGNANAQPATSVYVQNNDSTRDKFCVREGIDRCHSNRNNLHGKHKGDKVEFEDGEGHSRHGTILSEAGDSVKVMVDGEVYFLSKETGKCHGHRKASEAEKQEFVEMQTEQRIAEQAAEQRKFSEAIAESVKEVNKKYETRMYEQKEDAKEATARIYEKKADTKVQNVQSLSTQMDCGVVKNKDLDLTVAQVILGKQNEEILKGRK